MAFNPIKNNATQLGFAKFLIYLVVGSLVVFRGVLYELDSYAFLEQEINRSPGYVLFLTFFKNIFGGYYQYPVLFFQLVCSIWAVHYLHTCLQKLLAMGRVFSILSLLILIAPLLYLHLVANKILTEGLAYPLYLLFTAYSLYALYKKEGKYLIYAAIALFILIFVRGQFLSLVPIGFMVSIYLFYHSRNKKIVLISLVFIAIPFLTNIADRSYHYFFFGHFVATPTAHHLTSPILYVAAIDDSKFLETKEEKEYFRRVKTQLDQKQWTSEAADKNPKTDRFGWYSINYSNICNQTLQEVGMQFYREKGLSHTMQYLATDTLNMRIYWPLLKNNFKEWMALYLQNIKAALGNSKYLLLHIILFGAGLFLMKKKPDEIIGTFLVFIIGCVFSNIALLAIVTNSEKRFTFYHDWVLFIIMFLLLDRFFKSTKINLR